MRDYVVPAVARVFVRSIVLRAAVPARTAIGILFACCDRMFVYVLIVHVMQVSVVHVVSVVVVFNGSMPAARTMLVVVFLVSRVCHSL